MKERILSVVLSVVLALFAVSASIAAPILCRPFYYAQIDALSIPESTGWSKEVIREAFDDMMDYELKGEPFKIHAADYTEHHTAKQPGSIVAAGKAGIEIACGEGKTVLVTELQAPGKKRMKAADYLLGHPMEVD